MNEVIDGVQLRFRAKNVELTDHLRGFAEEKLSKLEHHFDQILEAEVELLSETNPAISAGETAEVTLFTRGPVIRAKESTSDIRTSIDMVVGKLNRQIEKYKDKSYRSAGHGRPVPEEAVLGTVDSGLGTIVKVKRVPMKPMTPQEAVLQMDLVGHDFFVFTNSDTDELNVVYKRRDRNYGLIEPSEGQ